MQTKEVAGEGETRPLWQHVGVAVDIDREPGKLLMAAVVDAVVVVAAAVDADVDVF